MMKKKKVLWFSRHIMSDEQRSALGDDVEIVNINKTISSAYEISDEIADADIIAIVAPVNLQMQFLKLAGDKPVIMAKSERVFTKDAEGNESKVAFKFLKWERLVKIDIVLEDFVI